MCLPHPILPLLSQGDRAQLPDSLPLGEGIREPGHLWDRAFGDLDQPHPGLSWREERRLQICLFLPVLCDSGAPPFQPHLLTPKRKEALTIATQHLPRASISPVGACSRTWSLAWGTQDGRDPELAGLLLCTLTPSLPLHCSPTAMNAGLPPQIERKAATPVKAPGRIRSRTGPGVLARMAPPVPSVTSSLGASRPRQVAGLGVHGMAQPAPKMPGTWAVWLRVPARDRAP